MAKPKMTKDIVPEDFTLGMAVVDFLPCLFFAGALIVLGIMLNSILMYVGGAVSFIGGTIKAIWKVIVVLKNKNVWWMFVQMRITLPLGYLIMLIAFIIACFNTDISIFFYKLLDPFVLTLMLIGVIGMVMMIVFAAKLDSSDARSNWIEQLCNSVSQMSFFLAFLLALLL